MRWLEAFEGFDRSAQLRRARASSALTATLTPAEADLLGRISTRVHRHDSMYLPGQAEHYLSVGLSAARVLGAALQAKPTPSVGSVLDFPCGYGRVLRFLKAMFPEASVTALKSNADPPAPVTDPRQLPVDGQPLYINSPGNEFAGVLSR